MESYFTNGGWLPLWILGAPLLIGLVALFMTPRPGSLRGGRDGYGSRSARPL